MQTAKYSPDLNPNEQVFSKLKGLLQKAGERTYDAVSDATAKNPQEIPAQRMRSVSQERRLCVKPIANGSRTDI
jgi:transposase